MSLVNVKKVNQAKAFSYIKIGFGGFFSFVFATFAKQMKDNTANMVLALIFLIPFALILLSGIKSAVRLKRLYRIDSVLSGVKSHSVKLSVLSEVTGIKEKKLTKSLKRYIKKNHLQNCIIKESELIIQSESLVSEITLVCPQCGKEFKAQNGAVARCPDCASIINIQ